MLVKTCGMTDPKNVQQVARLPIDWLGFIFYEPSPRYMGDAQALFQFLDSPEGRALPQKRVGVFVNATLPALLNNARDYRLDFIQLHGDESPEAVAALHQALLEQGSTVQLIKAVGVDAQTDFEALRAYEPYCAYFLLDTKTKQYGGSGRAFDWKRLEDYALETPFLLSGGLGPTDGAALSALVHPRLAGIDLNSQFETAPGIKCPQRLSWFFHTLPLSISNPFY